MKTIYVLSTAALLMGTTAHALPVATQPQADEPVEGAILVADLAGDFRNFLAGFGRNDDRYDDDDRDDDDDDRDDDDDDDDDRDDDDDYEDYDDDDDDRDDYDDYDDRDDDHDDDDDDDD